MVHPVAWHGSGSGIVNVLTVAIMVLVSFCHAMLPVTQWHA
jgi:hypothetical protein